MRYKIQLSVHGIPVGEFIRLLAEEVDHSPEIALELQHLPPLRFGGAEPLLLAIVTSGALTALITGILKVIPRNFKIEIESSDGSKVKFEGPKADMDKVKELAGIVESLNAPVIKIEES
jgi:hypothetical protein